MVGGISDALAAGDIALAAEILWLSLKVIWRQGAQELPFKLLFGHAREALAACDAALVASGTATLEAALLKAPMVIAYRLAPLSWHLMRRMRLQPWIGLPNILAGRFVVPEFIQQDASAENLAQADACSLAGQPTN